MKRISVRAVALLILLFAGFRTADADRLKPTFVTLAGQTIVASAVATQVPYNADRTGARDSTSGIQAALDAVAGLGGGVVYLPAGKYRCDGGLKIGYSVVLEGAGGDPQRFDAAHRTTLIDTAAAGNTPLIDVTAGEGGVVGLGVWYTNQSADDPVGQTFTIVASMADVRDVCLYNSYHGVLFRSVNCACVDHLVGTVLRRGLVCPSSSEFGWARDIRFSHDYWKIGAAEYGSAAMTPDQSGLLDRFTRAYLVGLEIGRVDGLIVDGLRVADAAMAVRIEKNTDQEQHRAFGFGGIVRDFPGPRDEVWWNPWYYGLHYADLDTVPESKTLSSPVRRSVPGPAKRDPASFLDVTQAPYAAIGDGNADDTAAVQAALNAAGRSGGGTVYLPQGTYRITNPLSVPSGVELRGPLGRGKSREYRNTCTLAADFGADTVHPDSDPALLTLMAHSGVRGFEIAYPHQNFDGATLRRFPYAIRGQGAGVWVVDLELVDAYNGIDLASARCDRHFISGLWATALNNGIVVGGGSKSGDIEHTAFSVGPFAESYLVPAAQRGTSTTYEYMRRHMVPYTFGACDGETGWGMVSFAPRIHFQFRADNGVACTNATFWMTMLDVGFEEDLRADAGRNIRFLGLWATGTTDGTHNWLEVGPSFTGPLAIYAKSLQPTFIAHPYTFTGKQVRLFDEVGYATGAPAAASASAAGHTPAMAVDRNPHTWWQAPAGSWLQVDLGHVRRVNRFAIENAALIGDGKNNTRLAELYLSEDGKTFHFAGRLDTFGQNAASRPVLLTRARYVRLRVIQPGQDHVIRVVSFDVFGEEPGMRTH